MQTLDSVLAPNIIELSLLSVNDIARTMLKHNDTMLYKGVSREVYNSACERLNKLMDKEVFDVELAMCFISTTTEEDLIKTKKRQIFLNKSLKNSYISA